MGFLLLLEQALFSGPLTTEQLFSPRWGFNPARGGAVGNARVPRLKHRSLRAFQNPAARSYPVGGGVQGQAARKSGRGQCTGMSLPKQHCLLGWRVYFECGSRGGGAGRQSPLGP